MQKILKDNNEIGEITQEELDQLIVKYGLVIKTGGCGPEVEKPNNKYCWEIQDGRGNAIFGDYDDLRLIPENFAKDSNYFFNADFYVFDSIKDKLVPLVVKYNRKIYLIPTQAWKARDGRSENYTPAEIPITEPYVYKDGKLKCQCDFSGCGHYSGGDCALTKNLEKCVFKNRYHYRCCPRRRQMIENGETVLFNGKWLLQGETLTD